MMAPEGLDTTTLSLGTVMMKLSAIITNLVSGIIVDTLGVFAVYRITFAFLLLWMVLYFGTWAFGIYVLKKKPPVPMFLRKKPAKAEIVKVASNSFYSGCWQFYFFGVWVRNAVFIFRFCFLKAFSCILLLSVLAYKAEI